MDETEYNLVRATAEGDPAAFEELVKRYERPVLNFIHRYLGDRYMAEDLSQEVFLRVYRSASSFEPRGRVSAWVFGIAYNLSMSELRRRKRYDRLRDAVSKSVENEPRESEAAELREELMPALRALPENQRAALLLRVNEELSYAEISRVLSVSVSSVESLLFRARVRMRELMKKD